MKFIHTIFAAILLNSLDVSGFSTVKPLGFPSTPRGVTRKIGGPVAPSAIILPVSAAQSPLFMDSTCAREGKLRPKRNRWSRFLATLLSVRATFGRRLRRAAVVAWTAAFIFLASSGLNIQPSHASTMSVKEPVQERILSVTSPSVDQIVDRYVKKYMFEDDTYDPVESLYREAYQDATQGTYPKALKEVTASVLGQESGKVMVEKSDGNAFGSLLTSVLGMLKKRGLSEGAAIAVIAATFVFAGPFVFLVGGMVIGGASKRNMNKVMKKRYGDTYTVDATIRSEEDVEAPDDDDDDEEEEEEDDDDGDDDDEDDDGDDDDGSNEKK